MRLRGFITSFVVCLLTTVFLTGGCTQCAESPSDAPTESPKPTVGSDDYQILEIVLTDLVGFKDFDPMVGEGKKTRIVLSIRTAGSDGTGGSPGFLGDGQLNGEGHDKTPYLIAADIRVDLWRRNPKEPVSLAEFKPSSPLILLADLRGLRGFDGFSTKYPDARGYVVTWLPGFSKDGRAAVLRASFGPTAHGATLTYMLVKKGEHWEVVWRTVGYYG